MTGKRNEECRLIFGHLASRLGIIQRHGCTYTDDVKERRELKRVGHRITLDIECQTDLVPFRLAREGNAPDAARKTLELR